MYAMCLGLVTHLPAPSQREGGTPFRIASDWKSYVSNERLSREGPPLPFGKGPGDGLCASRSPIAFAHPTSTKSNAFAVQNIQLKPIPVPQHRKLLPEIIQRSARTHRCMHMLFPIGQVRHVVAARINSR